MVREQHARTRTAQPDTARRRDADETDPVRPVPTRGFEATARSSGFPGGVVGRARAAEGRGVGPGYARKVEVSRAEAGSWGGREREEDGSSGTEADGGGVGVGAKEEEQGRAGVGGQQPVGAVREAVRGSATIRIPETPTRRSGPASMDTMRYGAFSPENLSYVRNVEEPIPEDLGACDANVIELGRPWRAQWLRTEHRGEQARDKLMEKRERGRSSNI